MITIDRILTGLIQQTSDGELKWTTTAQKDSFVTSVDTIAVGIYDSSLIGSPDVRYRMVIYGESGDIVDKLDNDQATPGQLRQMAKLHTVARRSAHNAEAVFEKLAKGLRV